MFKRRDIPPVLLLLLLIILVMLTLSQILVVHNGRYGRNVHSMRRLQLELREMDLNLHALMMQNVPSIELHRRLLQNKINAQRVAEIISQASEPDARAVPASRQHHHHQQQQQQGLGRRFNASAAIGSSHQSRLQDRLEPTVNPGRLVNRTGVDNGEYIIPPAHHHSQGVLQRHAQGQEAPAAPLDGPGFSPGTASDANIRRNHGHSAAQRNSRDHQEFQITRARRDDARSNSTTFSSSLPPAAAAPPPPALRPRHPHAHGSNKAQVDKSVTRGDIRTSSPSTSPPSSSPPLRTTPRCPGCPNNCSLITPLRTACPPPPPPPGASEYASANTPQPTKARIKYCPPIPPSLKGRVFVNEHDHNSFTVDSVQQMNPEVQPGGQWRPSACVARHKVAIIIPYRDREEHLTILLAHLHPILQRQQLDYTIFVVEQHGKDTFNKARIMNIAFVEALKMYNFQCFVFHDVDLVPEDDRNMYSCPLQPRHMSVAIDEMGYKLAYQELVGGVLNMRTEHFQRVNGYSNLYWGWGAEDDDMAYRIMHVGLKITRPPEAVARYTMVKHKKRKPADWRKRAKLLYTGTRRFQFDGLNSLQYKLIRTELSSLFTHVVVDIGKPPRGF